MKRGAFTVSGPGLDTSYNDPGPALSRALTAASVAEEPCTFYVRNLAGDSVGHAERDDRGLVFVRRTRP